MKRKKSKKFHTYLVGIVTILAVLFIVVWGISGIIHLIRGAVLAPDPNDGQTLTDPYEKNLDITTVKPNQIIEDGFIGNFVKHDFPAYVTADGIPQEYLISFGIWEALNSEKFKRNIRYGDNGVLLVSAQDISLAISDHFNLSKAIVHKSVSIYGDFQYNAETKIYIVPVFGISEFLIPRMVSQKTLDAGRIEVTMDLINSLDQEDYVTSKNEDKYPKAVKTIKVVLKGKPSEYKFDSLSVIQVASAVGQKQATTTDSSVVTFAPKN